MESPAPPPPEPPAPPPAAPAPASAAASASAAAAAPTQRFPFVRAAVFVVAAGVFGATLAVRDPAQAEGIVYGAVGTSWRALLARASAVIPLSFGEMAIAAITLAATIQFLAVLFSEKKGRALFLGLYRGAFVGAVLGCLFMVPFGIGFRARPLAERLGLDVKPHATKEACSAELQVLALHAIRTANATRDRAGDPPKEPDLVAIHRATRRGFEKAFPALGLSAPHATAPAKPALGSTFATRLGVSGYYLPFSGEAHVNVLMPGSQWAETAAHEQAHQLGFPREDEASALGLLACILSEDAHVVAGGWKEIQERLRQALVYVDEVAAANVAFELSDKVKGDMRTEAGFWKRQRSAITAVGSAVNTAYLKSQGVADGVQSYGRVTELIVGLMRKHPELFGIAARTPEGASPR